MNGASRNRDSETSVRPMGVFATLNGTTGESRSNTTTARLWSGATAARIASR